MEILEFFNYQNLIHIQANILYVLATSVRLFTN